MKHWPLIALLMGPWVVHVSTDVMGNLYSIPLANDFSLNCNEETKDYCYDLAEALNQAHERRIKGLVK
jgi:hypothetical protein